MLVASLMSIPVMTVSPSTPIREAADFMLNRHFSALPVVDQNDTLVGIISEGDFLRRGELGSEVRRPRWLQYLVSPGKLADEYVRSHGRLVEEVMTREVITIDADASVEAAVNRMLDNRIKRLPVLTDGKLVGIVARSDLMRALASMLPINNARSADDAQIRAAVLRELSRQDWGAGDSFHVDVEAGVVTLSGIVLDERERLAARVAAENVPGVKKVVDKLCWV
jgi:CBS domain-containing protein